MPKGKPKDVPPMGTYLSKEAWDKKWEAEHPKKVDPKGYGKEHA